MSTIGERIKARRKELNLSVDELAAKIGKNRATIYRYENNEIENLPMTILEPLAKALDTTPGDLILGEKTESYYHDPVVEQMAEAYRNNSDMRILFDASRDLKPEEFEFVIDLINTMKKKEGR